MANRSDGTPRTLPFLPKTCGVAPFLKKGGVTKRGSNKKGGGVKRVLHTMSAMKTVPGHNFCDTLHYFFED